MSAVTARRLGDAACWVTPFLLFWWCLPFVTGTSLGNDYVRFSPECQLELMLSWEAGAWPLFVPGWAGGQSASALSMGQLHHPLSHLASWMPGYWSGHALEWMTFWRLVTLGGVHWLWWRLLRRLGWRDDLAFLVSLAAIYNLRMLDCFHYGAALEAYTGMLALCAALAWLGLAPADPRRRAGVAAATYWLLTSGHPQFALYGTFAVAGWAVAWPWLQRHAAPPDTEAAAPSVRTLWLTAGGCLAGGIALSAWWMVPYYVEFVRGAVMRAGDDYAWSLDYSDTVPGVLGVFGLPLRSDALTAFGGSVLAGLPLAAPLLLAWRRRWPPALWTACGGALLTLLYALGDATPVHGLAWEVVPFLARMRGPGRITIVWPVLLLGVAIIVHAAPALTLRWRGAERTVPPLALLVAAAAAIAVCSALLAAAWGADPAPYAPRNMRGAPAAADWLILGSGIAAAVAVFRRCGAPERAPWSGGLAIAAVGLQLLLALYWGTWIQPRVPTPALETLQARRAERWDYPARSGDGGADRVVVRQLTEGVVEPRLAWATTQAQYVPTVDAAFAHLARDRQPGTVVITEPGASEATIAGAPSASCRVAVTRAGYNQLWFDVDLPGDGWLVTNLPFTGRWHATAGSVELPTRAADGLGTAVRLGAGRTSLALTYESPAAETGVLLSALALALFGGWVSWSAASPRNRWIGVSACVVCAIVAPLWWHATLYAADLGYRWVWQSPPPPARTNLAYGKRVEFPHQRELVEPYLHAGGRAVDGDRAGRPAAGRSHDGPAHLVVDLTQVRALGAVQLFGAGTLPLTVELSRDGHIWEPAGRVATRDGGALAFPPGTAARYVKVRTAGTGELTLAELEIYPP